MRTSPKNFSMYQFMENGPKWPILAFEVRPKRNCSNSLCLNNFIFHCTKIDLVCLIEPLSFTGQNIKFDGSRYHSQSL